MNLLEQFKVHYEKNLSMFFPANSKFILAVSGGIDSVVLVDLFTKTNLNFSIAHCNFELRGDESNRDEAFVKALAAKNFKEIFVKHFDTKRYADENKISIQVAARELRYSWFKELQTSDFKLQTHLVTAHHCNDNIETVLIKFFRGTGINGLTGIDAFDKTRKIVRPLLPFKKEDLLQYATVTGLNYVEDSSNASNKYTRNNFRNQIIPLVAIHFPQVEENILGNINRMNDVQTLYHQAIEKHKTNLIVQKENEFHIPILKLKKVEPLYSIIWEIIKTFSFTPNQVNEIIKLLDAHNGSYVQSASHRILNNRKWLMITPLKDDTSHHIMIKKDEKIINFEKGKKLVLERETRNEKQETRNEIATIDIDTLEFPLLLRKWKQGDYFYPLGMNKKQKLSKFFINQKLSLIDKENVWVIESNKRIVWIVGFRIDNRFKLTDNTREVLKISYPK
jgi:tRNA(Ile)-lysidine synthase